jgi:2-iminobutanoate/2-iminopropanoate deaminase
MARQIVFTARAPKPPLTYSQAVKAAGLVFVSGTAPQNPETGTINGTTIQEQTRQCLANITAILEEAGSSLEKIVSATVVPLESTCSPRRQAPCQSSRAEDFYRRNCRGLTY